MFGRAPFSASPFSAESGNVTVQAAAAISAASAVAGVGLIAFAAGVAAAAASTSSAQATPAVAPGDTRTSVRSGSSFSEGPVASDAFSGTSSKVRPYPVISSQTGEAFDIVRPPNQLDGRASGYSSVFVDYEVLVAAVSETPDVIAGYSSDTGDGHVGLSWVPTHESGASSASAVGFSLPYGKLSAESGARGELVAGVSIAVSGYASSRAGRKLGPFSEIASASAAWATAAVACSGFASGYSSERGGKRPPVIIGEVDNDPCIPGGFISVRCIPLPET